MKQLRVIMLAVMMLTVGTINASVYIKYYNTDSKSYKFDVKTCGSSTAVEFGSSRTSTVTIQSGCSDAVIRTSCGEVTVRDGDKIVIKNGCISIE